MAEAIMVWSGANAVLGHGDLAVRVGSRPDSGSGRLDPRPTPRAFSAAQRTS